MSGRPTLCEQLLVSLFYLVVGFLAWMLATLAWALKSFFLGGIALFLVYLLLSPFIKASMAENEVYREWLRQNQPRVTGNLSKPGKKAPLKGGRLP